MTFGVSNSVLFRRTWERVQLDELDHVQGTEWFSSDRHFIPGLSKKDSCDASQMFPFYFSLGP